MPSSRSSIFACSLASPELMPLSSSGVSTFSTAVRNGKRLNSWNMKPMLSRRKAVIWASESVEVSTSLITISPEERRSKWPIMFRSVVFPHPEGPIIAIMSPCLTVRSIPWRAWTSLDLPSL